MFWTLVGIKQLSTLNLIFRLHHGLKQKKYNKIVVEMWEKWFNYKIYTKTNKKRLNNYRNNYKN